MEIISNSPKVSIITVSFNSVATIERTILSVINQTYSNIEYMIIDGGSVDGTVEIIEKYRDRIAYWISESDAGIYDAMNKGVIRATGDYILFLGSDDVFCNDMVISDAIADIISVGCPDLWCGRMRLIDYQSKLFKNVGRALSKRDILAGVMANHPAMLVKRYLLIEHPFDLNFKIAADQEFFVWCCNTGKKIAFSDICLVDFNTTGISSFSKKALNESRMIVRKYAPRFLKAFDRRTRKNYFMSYLIPILTKLRLLRVFRENTGWKKM